MAHVFISYSRKDVKYAEKLKDKLTKEGFDVWIDIKDIPPGEDWWEEIKAGIRSSDAFIIIMSPNSEVSPWVKREIHLADDAMLPTFPLLLRGNNFPIYTNKNYYDVTNKRVPKEDFYDALENYANRKAGRGHVLTTKVDIVPKSTIAIHSPLAVSIVIIVLAILSAFIYYINSPNLDDNLVADIALNDNSAIDTPTGNLSIAVENSTEPTVTLTTPNNIIATGSSCEYGLYTVQENDLALSRIARTFVIPLQNLYIANNLDASSTIRTGDELIIPLCPEDEVPLPFAEISEEDIALYWILTNVSDSCVNIRAESQADATLLGRLCPDESVVLSQNSIPVIPTIGEDGTRWERICIYTNTFDNVTLGRYASVAVGDWTDNAYTSYFDYELVTADEIDLSTCFSD